PDRLEITFFSYLEDQHYQGTFDLPYDKILTLFAQESNDDGSPMYDRIMVGVAPGGAVAVWLTGVARTVEVFFGKAEPVDMPLTGMRGRVVQDRASYVEGALEDALGPEFLKSIRTNGIPFNGWFELRKRYEWKPVLAYGVIPRDSADVKYFNGEFDRVRLPVDAVDRAVPQRIQFSYRSPEGWSYLYIIHFDEEETTTAFQQLGSGGCSLTLEFYPKKPIHNTRIRL